MTLEIIGPGFGRTGTNSLRLALEHLGFGPCHHMFEVRDNPEQLAAWHAAALGHATDWDKVLAGYRSQVDWPGVRFWRQLARHFPNAKVVLTVRDPDDWFDSLQATLVPFMAARGTHLTAHLNAIADFGYEAVATQTFNNRMSDRAYTTSVFLKHIADVQSEIPGHRLLTFDLRDGWRPLCEFLCVDVPAVPFPKTNSTKGFVKDEWTGTEVPPGQHEGRPR